jgi:hypothetical protein
MLRHPFALAATPVLIALALTAPAEAAVRRVPYPEVKVEVAEAYKPDPAFSAMRKAFSDAVAKKDGNALFALVGPTFVWTMAGALVEQFDMGRDALHNFKVVFGFRDVGKDADGGVDGGPYWDLLAGFAADSTSYTQNDNLVCSPTYADIVDDKILEQARSKIDTKDETADWYFTLADTPVAKAPGDTGPPVGKVGKVALPVLSVHPPTPEGKPTITPTHYEVLMPNGKTGWIPAAAARPLESERLCYAKTPKDEWKIVSYDQLEEAAEQ